MRYSMLGILAAFGFAWQGATQAVDLKPVVPNGATVQAHASLQALKQLTTAKTYKELGFGSPRDANAARLGDPFRVYMVRLDKLRNYDANRDPKDIIDDTNAVRYPVVVGSETRSGILVREVQGHWQAASVGRPVLTKALVAVARKQGAKAGEPQIVVKVPALNLYFVGIMQDGQLQLASAADDPRFKIEAGKMMPARQVLASLVPFARAMGDERVVN